MSKPISNADLKHITMMVIDQATWRQMEWGDDLIEGQFDDAGVPFTKDNVKTVYNWVSSDEGKAAILDIFDDNSCYWDYCDSPEEALDDWVMDDCGCWFGKDTWDLAEAAAS